LQWSPRKAILPSHNAVAWIRRNPVESNKSLGLPDGGPVRIPEKAKAQVTVMYTQPDGPSDSSSIYQPRLYRPRRAAPTAGRRQGSRP